jgi:hypothetical protein
VGLVRVFLGLRIGGWLDFLALLLGWEGWYTKNRISHIPIFLLQLDRNFSHVVCCAPYPALSCPPPPRVGRSGALEKSIVQLCPLGVN